MGRMKLSFSSYYFFFLTLVLLFFHTRGVIIHDEGYVINSAQKIFAGLTIYKDFHFSYTPGSVYSVALSFLLFGHSILASRILMLFCSIISSFLLFKIAQKITRRNIYGYISSAIYVAWGPSHINFAWPVMFVLPITFLVLFLLLKFNETKKAWIPFIVGLLCITDFLFKQNFGIIIIPVALSLLTVKGIKKIHLLYALYGFLWGIVFLGIYLLATNSLTGFVSDFYEFTIKKIIINNEITTPLIYKDTFLRSIARLSLYFSPFYLSFAAFAILFYRKRYHLLFLPLTVFLFLIVGIRPTTDYVHVVPILSMLGIPIIIILNQLPTSLIKLAGYTLIIFLLALGFHTALFKGYYRWDQRLSENNSFVANNLNVFTNQAFKLELHDLSTTVNKYSEKNDYIFVNTYAPLLYFALDRQQPSTYDFPGFTDSNTYQKEVVYSLITKDVKLIFLIDKDEKSEIGDFTRKYYAPLGQVGNYYLFKKT